MELIRTGSPPSSEARAKEDTNNVLFYLKPHSN